MKAEQRGGDQYEGDQRGGDQHGGDQREGDRREGDQRGGDQRGGDQCEQKHGFLVPVATGVIFCRKNTFPKMLEMPARPNLGKCWYFFSKQNSQHVPGPHISR